MEASFAPYFDVASTAAFGGIAVALGKRKPGADYPCAEVLQVTVADAVSDDDMQRYLRFHRSFVVHREAHDWPHQYAFVYDVRRYVPPPTIPELIEKLLAFIMTHSSLGDIYKRWLFKTGVVIAEPAHAAILAKAMRASEVFMGAPPSKPLLTHVVDSAGASAMTLAARMR